MFGSGRKSSAENEVSVNEDGKTICQHCKNTISSKIERIRAHLKKCHIWNTSIYEVKNDVSNNNNEEINETPKKTKNSIVLK